MSRELASQDLDFRRARRSQISEREALLFLMILPPALLVVDSVTGALAFYGVSSPLSQLVKGLVLIWLLVICVKLNPASAFKPIGMLGVVGLLSLYHLSDASNSAHWSTGLAWALRYCLIVFSALVCKAIVERGHYRLAWAGIGGLLSLIIIGVNLVVGLMGFGYAQYGEAYGTSGFFVAGNELAVALISASVLALGHAYSGSHPIRFWIIFLLFAAAALVSLTKAALVSVLIILLAMPLLVTIHVGKQGYRTVGNRRLTFALGSLVGMAALPLATLAYIYFSGFIDRLRYFFDLDGWTGLIFSGRQQFVENALQRFFEHSSILDVLLGQGVGWVLDVIGHQIEVDPVDFLVAFGVVGMLCAYAIIIYFLSGPFEARRRYYFRSTASDFAWMGGVLILAISCFAGHVLNSGLACVLFGLVLGVARAQVPMSIRSERGSAFQIWSVRDRPSSRGNS